MPILFEKTTLPHLAAGLHHLKRKLWVFLMFTGITGGFTRQCGAQGTLSAVSARDVSYAPLFLFTSGAGSVSPFHDGQLLEAGVNYEMEGIPDSGSVFSSWQPVNVFTLVEVVRDASGDQYTNTSSVASLIPEYVETSVLTFTVQPGQVLLDNPGVRMLTESRGWQANFVAVPEPSSIALIVCGLGVTVCFWRKRLQEGGCKMNRSN